MAHATAEPATTANAAKAAWLSCDVRQKMTPRYQFLAQAKKGAGEGGEPYLVPSNPSWRFIQTTVCAFGLAAQV